MLAGAEEADDVGMVELLEDVRLALEALGGPAAAGAQAGGHHLDGDELARLGVAAAVDGPHGAAAEFLVDDERPDLLSDEHDCTCQETVVSSQ